MEINLEPARVEKGDPCVTYDDIHSDIFSDMGSYSKNDLLSPLYKS